jgi:broad specificity phosphatase PhoE
MRSIASLTAVRHGESTANAAFHRAARLGIPLPPIHGPDADVPLSARGMAQARAVGRWLGALGADVVPQAVICSPFRRARHTAELAWTAAARPLPDIVLDERARDREMGVLELLGREAIAERHPAEAARRARVGELRYRPPGGESMLDVALRLRGLLADLHDRHAGRRLLLIGHDSVVLMLRQIIEGLDEQEVLRISAAGLVDNGSVTTWRAHAGRLRLAEYNVTTHLADPDDTPLGGR